MPSMLSFLFSDLSGRKAGIGKKDQLSKKTVCKQELSTNFLADYFKMNQELQQK